jgi:hypothetical protein
MVNGPRYRKIDEASIRGTHQGQRSRRPRPKAGHMTASDPDARSNFTLASGGPSTHDHRLDQPAACGLATLRAKRLARQARRGDEGQAGSLFADDGSIASEDTRNLFRTFITRFAAWIEVVLS